MSLCRAEASVDFLSDPLRLFSYLGHRLFSTIACFQLPSQTQLMLIMLAQTARTVRFLVLFLIAADVAHSSQQGPK